MKSRHARIVTMAAALAFAAPIILPLSPAAAIPVFDATNYAQNILQAARALEQINNQIRSLQAQAQMLRNMEKNLKRIDFPEVGEITSRLQKIDRLMGEARGIDFRTDQLDARLRSIFPDQLDRALRTDGRLAAAKARLDTADAAFRHTIAVQAQVAQNVKEDAALLADLMARSQGAEGGLEAAQATNQLLALSTKQQLQLQSLMAAEFRSQAIERARRAQEESDARAVTKRFLGSGKAYSPD